MEIVKTAKEFGQIVRGAFLYGNRHDLERLAMTIPAAVQQDTEFKRWAFPRGKRFRKGDRKEWRELREPMKISPVHDKAEEIKATEEIKGYCSTIYGLDAKACAAVDANMDDDRFKSLLGSEIVDRAKEIAAMDFHWSMIAWRMAWNAECNPLIQSR